jgi:hypothetical protein
VAILDANGGAMSMSKCMEALYDTHAKSRAIIKTAGGGKAFCLQHSGIVQFRADGDGVITRTPHNSGKKAAKRLEQLGGEKTVQPAPPPMMNEQDVVKALAAQLAAQGPQMKTPNCMALLNSSFPAAKAVVKSCGGPKAFCARHSELEFITGPGAGEIRLNTVRAAVAAGSRVSGSSQTHAEIETALMEKASKAQHPRTAARDANSPSKPSGGVKSTTVSHSSLTPSVTLTLTLTSSPY